MDIWLLFDEAFFLLSGSRKFYISCNKQQTNCLTACPFNTLYLFKLFTGHQFQPIFHCWSIVTIQWPNWTEWRLNCQYFDEISACVKLFFFTFLSLKVSDPPSQSAKNVNFQDAKIYVFIFLFFCFPEDLVRVFANRYIIRRNISRK